MAILAFQKPDKVIMLENSATDDSRKCLTSHPALLARRLRHQHHQN